jgi:hypothetical protein
VQSEVGTIAAMVNRASRAFGDAPELTGDADVTLLCPGCGRAIRADRAHVSASHTERAYSCPDDGTTLATVASDSVAFCCELTIRLGDETVSWGQHVER